MISLPPPILKKLPFYRYIFASLSLLILPYRYSAAGRWLHVFPEGGIWQNKYTLGGRFRDGRDRKIGQLKWGIGKLIAHSPVIPIVIPFYHYGMETILPQDPETKILTRLVYIYQYLIIVTCI